MKFIVTRTSMMPISGKPCETATLSMCENWDIRTCTEEEFDKKFSSIYGKWRSIGTEHGLCDDGCIKRRMEDREYWCIDINSVDDLVKFVKEHGEVVIDADEYYGATPSIEIYDDRRE